MSRKLLRNVIHALMVILVTAGSFSYLFLGNTAHASEADNREMYNSYRAITYFVQCLRNHVDLNGNDGNGQNELLENETEIFRNTGSREVIATGLDFDAGNGVESCETVANDAMHALSIESNFDFIFKDAGFKQPGFLSDPNYNQKSTGSWDTSKLYQDILESMLWGKALRELKGNEQLKVNDVGSDNIKRRANKMATAIEKFVKAPTGATYNTYARKFNLERVSKLLGQCFTWESSPPGDRKDIKDNIALADYGGKGHSIYGSPRSFNYDNTGIPINDVNYKFGFSGTPAGVGNITLGWSIGNRAVDSGWNERTSNWYPLGNDLGSAIAGDWYKNGKQGYYKNGNSLVEVPNPQTMLACDWIKAKADYLFNREQANKYYFGYKEGGLKLLAKEPGSKSSKDDSIAGDVAAGTTNDSPGAKTGDECGGGSGGGALRWIMCPIIKAIDGAISWSVEKLIKPALELTPLENGGTLYLAWQNVRNFANALLVLIFMIIIFANFFTSNGSSYTIKKALPRIIAAAILLQFSYFLCAVLVDVGNVLGNGIGTLIVGTVGAAGGSGASFAQNLASGLLLTGGVAITAAVVVMLEAWVFVIPLAIGLVISIITLVLSLGVRLIALNLLIILSPLALLAWILPNTEKYFKLWSSNILKLVMMYPLIIAMMSAATVVVKIGAGNSNGTFVSLLTLFAPMIAFFMIPATLKMSGTLISGINGAIASRGKSFSNATAGTIRKGMAEDLRNRSGRMLGDKKVTGFKRQVAMVASGNMFSRGSAGRVKIAASVARGRKAQDEVYDDVTHQAAMKNPETEGLLSQIEKGATTVSIGGKSMKVDEGLKRALIRRLASNGGDKELTKLINGSIDPETGKSVGGWYDFEKGEFKGHYRELLEESLSEGQRATLLGKAPHAIHGKGSQVYPDIDAKVLSSMNDENGEVAIREMLRAPERVAKTDENGKPVLDQFGQPEMVVDKDSDGNIKFKAGINEDGAKRLVEQMITVAHSTTMSGATKKGVTKAIKNQMEAHKEYFQNMAVETSDGTKNAYDLFLGADGQGGLISSTGSVVYTDKKMAVGGAPSTPGSTPANPGGGTFT